MSWKNLLHHPFSNVLQLSMLVGFTILIIIAAASIRTYRLYPLESKESIMNRKDTGIVLLDRQGQPFFTFYQPRLKTYTKLQDVPQHVQNAVVAAEDKEFYSHYGFSVRGIARSAYYNFMQKKVVSGGSTITQQLVKNSLLTPERTFERKYKEIILAFKLEQNFSKDDILEMYLNSAYFGEGVFGIEEASHRYFNKSAQELNVSEAAMIAGLLPAPSAFSPFAETGISDRSMQRQAFVLTQMVQGGFITPEEKEAALKQELVFNTAEQDLNRHAPHFALMVRDQLVKQFGEEFVTRSGFRVKTSLDMQWQEYAETAVQTHVEKMKTQDATNASAVVIDPVTREVRALVGSVNWQQESFGKINMAISPRQTGSTFKPIVYAAALETQQITPSSILQDKPKTYGKDYKPVNYDGRFRGQVTARFALANSLNIPAVETTNLIGPQKVVRMAERLGITSMRKDAAYNLATALGAENISLLEMTNAYATFANSGIYEEPKLILEVMDKHNESVPIPVLKPVSALDARIAFMISSILSDNDIRRVTFGNLLRTNPPSAAKTGTTQDFRDAWTIGYTPHLTVGVWLGNSDNRPMKKLAGASGAAPLWRDLLEHYSAQEPYLTFTPPDGLVALRVCQSRGLLVGQAGRSGYQEYFLQGTEPTKYCSVPKKEEPTPEPGEGLPPEEQPVPEPKEDTPKKKDPVPEVVQGDTNPLSKDNS